MLSRIAGALVLLTATVSMTTQASAADDLLGFVPGNMALVVSIDHSKLAAHPHYASVLKFMASQGWTAGLSADAKSGMVPGKDVKRSVVFRSASDRQGAILKGAFDVAAIKAYHAKAVGKSFKEGAHASKAWFSVGKRLVAADLGGGKLLVAPLGLAQKVLDLAAGKGAKITSSKAFTALHKEASGGSPALWATAVIPDRTRKRFTKKGMNDMAMVRTASLKMTGTKDLTFLLKAHTKDPADAAVVAKGVQGKIDRKIMGSTILRGLGVASIASKAKIEAKGKRVDITMPLTANEVGLIAGVGGTVLSALR